VVAGSAGQLCGVEGVIDKDLAAALLARELDADMLLMLTDVSAVQAGWGTPDAHDVRVSTPRDVPALDLAAGSMGPKAEAAARFVETTGRRSSIGALADARAIVDGRAGTLVAPSDATNCTSPLWALLMGRRARGRSSLTSPAHLPQRGSAASTSAW
jgi:carbamate kinase